MERETVDQPFVEDSRSPHESLYIVIAYLPLYELLVMTQVCRSLRDAVNNDILPWLKIVVIEPLNKVFADDHLIKVASKANRRLTVLALFDCSKISDLGILQVVGCNPLITTLCVPACTSLTPNGIIEAVKLLTKNNHKLNRLTINGIPNMKIEHLEILRGLLGDQNNSQSNKKTSNFYHTFKTYQRLKQVEIIHPLDVDLCPKCHEVCMVFDCPKESCKKASERKHMECRGCSNCVIRCEECGVCINENNDDDEGEETACGESLCLDCWLQLEKCSFCNRPYCNQHYHERCILPGSIGWICVACKTKCDTRNDIYLETSRFDFFKGRM